MPHASIGEAMDVLQLQNKLLISIPEVESVVGKIGRADSPLDPAPISMIETFISLQVGIQDGPERQSIGFSLRRRDRANTSRDEKGNLIEDSSGRPFRQWREEIKSPNDIWAENHRSGRHSRHHLRSQIAADCRSYRDAAKRNACTDGHED